MAKEEKEQIIELKDGRTIFKTHNGFKWWLKDQKGSVTEVTEAYYNQAKLNRKK
jgi:hypothetical protein